ncbi:effector binding domain-containing protein [Treponema brennaborense]|uniref:Helix-turn-helix, AraC domain protein n=1 Tax=Treponema brennaborense (strain DSM 12168 / CIP 105900 / DD5/3) TaxID=906968 RepID=F4LJ68_TREBD|nr:effector binding domain-containing protein [Treponema brennaborense]AEE16325.1 Helix-turn-helix, AraC domain protein [Treponema brennaborense DSM 12168]
MNGYECVRKSILIFELQLAQRIESARSNAALLDGAPVITGAAQLAELSGYSPWHFGRLFAAVTGCTPKSYVAGRILSRCAAAIVQSAGTGADGTGTTEPAAEKNEGKHSHAPYGTLVRLALAAGFADYETFSRSFKRRFKISPRTLQKQGTLDGVAAYLCLPFDADGFAENAGGALHDTDALDAAVRANGLRADIVSRPPLHITGLSFFLDEKQSSFADLWRAFDSKRHRIGACREPERFCQYTAWVEPEAPCRSADDSMLVVCALETDAAHVQEPVFVNRTIPGGTFLHVIHSGSMETIGDTYAAIYRNIVAARSSPLASCWEYQLYNADGTTGIFIPLD